MSTQRPGRHPVLASELSCKERRGDAGRHLHSSIFPRRRMGSSMLAPVTVFFFVCAYFERLDFEMGGNRQPNTRFGLCFRYSCNLDWRSSSHTACSPGAGSIPHLFSQTCTCSRPRRKGENHHIVKLLYKLVVVIT
jgi:hypothetical protein